MSARFRIGRLFKSVRSVLYFCTSNVAPFGGPVCFMYCIYVVAEVGHFALARLKVDLYVYFLSIKPPYGQRALVLKKKNDFNV